MFECVPYIKFVFSCYAVKALPTFEISSNPFMNGLQVPKTLKYINVIK